MVEAEGFDGVNEPGRFGHRAHETADHRPALGDETSTTGAPPPVDEITPSVVDEGALIDLLTSGGLAGAGLERVAGTVAAPAARRGTATRRRSRTRSGVSPVPGASDGRSRPSGQSAATSPKTRATSLGSEKAAKLFGRFFGVAGGGVYGGARPTGRPRRTLAMGLLAAAL